MLLLVLAFLGGILTIVSCILPVLPFVFAKADQPFRKSGLPLLIGMALTFSAFAAIATTGGAWLVRANQYGRVAALIALAFFGLTLLWPALAIASRVRSYKQAASSRSLLTHPPAPAVRCCWAWRRGCSRAPCAGPILGLILTGAAISGASGHSVFLRWLTPRAQPHLWPWRCSPADAFSPRSKALSALRNGYARCSASPCWQAWSSSPQRGWKIRRSRPGN